MNSVFVQPTLTPPRVHDPHFLSCQGANSKLQNINSRGLRSPCGGRTRRADPEWFAFFLFRWKVWKKRDNPKIVAHFLFKWILVEHDKLMYFGYLETDMNINVQKDLRFEGCLWKSGVHHLLDEIHELQLQQLRISQFCSRIPFFLKTGAGSPFTHFMDGCVDVSLRWFRP